MTLSNFTSSPPQKILPLLTLTLWLLTLTIGLLGLRLPYPNPTPTPPAQNPTQLVNVTLPETPPPSPQPEIHPDQPDQSDQPLPTPSAIPPAPQPAPIPQAPPIAVALPSPTIAFALPVESFTKIVDPNQAAHTRSTNSSTGTSNGTGTNPTLLNGPPPPSATHANPPVTNLILGQGEGNQPAPDYPRDAISAQQEGTVTLRFDVDQTGQVTNVQILTPSKYPLLNRAATKTIKERWHFPPGQPRTYQVPIQFQLTP